MSEFLSLATWLRPAGPQTMDEPVAVSEEAEPFEKYEGYAPEDTLVDDVCARVRRFRAMLDDAFAYVRERGAPVAPLRVRVHPTQLSSAQTVGLPLTTDARLREEEAILELRCGSIDAQLSVPLVRLLAKPQS